MRASNDENSGRNDGNQNSQRWGVQRLTVEYLTSVIRGWSRGGGRLHLSNLLYILSDGTMYLLGPVLIVFAIGIICILSHTFFTIFVPMMVESQFSKWRISLHVTWVLYLLLQITWNYFWCVTTKHNGPTFHSVVREVADATGFVYPETPEELLYWKDQVEVRVIARRRRLRRRQGQEIEQQIQARLADPQQQQQQQPEMNIPSPIIRPWMLMGPKEWGYCSRSKSAKPPRAHYDHVTKLLVLNMDHYCPWMFNTIGYLNYRYFVNFLVFVTLGMMYGAMMSYRPFMNFHILPKNLRNQVNNEPWTPTASQNLPVAFCFMICSTVGFSVMWLTIFHLYLSLTAQTTIEFHGNLAERRAARIQGFEYRNPYDLGLRRNFQQLWGSGNPYLAVLIPSSREPEFLPVPDLGKRHPKSKESCSDSEGSEESTTSLLSKNDSTVSRRVTDSNHKEDNNLVNV